MKKILMMALIIALTTSFGATTTYAAKGLKNKASKVLFRDPGRFKGKWVPFKIDSITYQTYYRDETAANEYGISIKGKVEGKKESIYYKAGSIEEIQYYQDIFNGDYKEIRLFMNDYKNSACKNKKCFTYGIVVEL